ncbi:hypothetical protein [Flavobacterium sp.]|uniref:hypothetical protein n=1 Tax=Flavobacterium sp. TaxID=239 RepID=UPI002606AE80|nr:hypothetical protein [Flavobacterium sp.]
MNLKNFFIAGIVGGIVDFLLGWVFYGMLFKEIYPQTENTNLTFIFLGCMTSGFFISYIFTKWAGITNAVTGLMAGAIIGFFSSLSMNFFMYSGMPLNTQNMITDIAISTLISGCMGAVIAIVSGKMK